MIRQAAALFRVDFAPQHRQPSPWRVVLATIASLAGSLAADAILVVLAQVIFPVTRGYQHFRFSDYATLTIIGVLIACVAWPVVTRVTSAPRWLFFRLAILVTLVLLLPDLYILYQGQPTDAVIILMIMHVAIALVTYNFLVDLAPAVPLRHTTRRRPGPPDRMYRRDPDRRDRPEGRDRPDQRDRPSRRDRRMTGSGSRTW